MNLDEYINNYDKFQTKIVYNFELGWGGLGDNIKFFMYILSLCIQHNVKLYYLINNTAIEKYIRLKYQKMYINKNDINESYYAKKFDISKLSRKEYNMVNPFYFYNIGVEYLYGNILLKCEDVFFFSNEVKQNSEKLLSDILIKNIGYISIHLRLGDKYLETDKSFVMAKNDERDYDEEKFFLYIETNHDKPIIFFCDNNSYKLKIKKKYNNIIIINSDIGHTSLQNTTDKQTLDTISEFYIMTNSEKIIAASYSGFSKTASKFKNIPIDTLY